MLESRFAVRFLLIALLGGGLDASAVAHAAEPPSAVALVRAGRGLLEWTPLVESEGMTLALANPQGVVRTLYFASGQAPALSLFDTRGIPLPDGTYTWELRVTPRLGADQKREIEDARRRGDTGQISSLSAPLVQSGYFTLDEGSLVASDLTERPERRSPQGPSPAPGVATTKDQVVPDDLIVDGKGCIGLGCANGESFGAEALRLKQSVVRLRFEDTSAQPGFPTRDWQLTVNDPGSGGADRFSIEDLTAGRTPLTLRGNAPDNALFIDSNGKIGLRTATPAQDIHIASGNTPAVRLEQTTGGGFPAQTWDLAASDTGFAVRDVTSARTPLQIKPGAPSDSVSVTAGGFVGLGTASPATKLHVRGSGGSTKLMVEESSTTTGPRELLEARNNGSPVFIFKDLTEAERWSLGTWARQFVIDNQARAGVEYNFSSTGNLTIAGTLTVNSDRTTKTDIQPIDPQVVLAKIAELPVSTWRRIGDTSNHLGPMAQDFRAAFGLGEDERHIAPGDLAGVSLAAVQGLNTRVEEQAQTIEQQRQAIAKQQELIRQLEERLAHLENRQ